MTIHVASLPLDHVYVRHLAPPDGGGRVVRGGADRPDADLVHVHLGLAGASRVGRAPDTRGVLSRGAPSVVTVHDLPPPRDRSADRLVRSADAIVVLTPAAAAAVRRRWGREAQVLPHPHVVSPDLLARPRTVRDHVVVGLQRGGLHAGASAPALVEKAALAVAGRPRVRVDLDLPSDVLDPATHEHLAGLDVLVLARRPGAGTWLEAAHDVGTTVVTPDGLHAGQRPCLTYRAGDASSLVRALQEALEAAPGSRLVARERYEERVLLAAAHEEIYARVLGRVVACTS